MTGRPDDHPSVTSPAGAVFVIMLAAGGGSRFTASATAGAPGSPHKLLADLAGRPVYRHALDHCVEAAVGPVVVVTGAVELLLPDAVERIHNPQWADGQAGSLQLGLAAAAAGGAEHVLVGLADQPGIPAAAWRLVAHASSTWPIVVASYDEGRGPNPVRLHRSLWAQVPSTGDEGARTLMRQRPDLVHEVRCPGTAHDIDTLEDLQRWTSS